MPSPILPSVTHFGSLLVTHTAVSSKSGHHTLFSVKPPCLPMSLIPSRAFRFLIHTPPGGSFLSVLCELFFSSAHVSNITRSVILILAGINTLLVIVLISFSSKSLLGSIHSFSLLRLSSPSGDKPELVAEVFQRGFSSINGSMDISFPPQLRIFPKTIPVGTRCFDRAL